MLHIEVRLYMCAQTHTVKHQLDFVRWISVLANYFYQWKLQKPFICGSKQRGNKLIANPGVFHTPLRASHKCHGEVSHLEREYTQAARRRTTRSTPHKAVYVQMAWVVLAAYAKATDTSHVIHFRMNLAGIGLATSSRSQFSRVKKPGLRFVVFTELSHV